MSGQILRCSFCGKQEKDVRAIVEGPFPPAWNEQHRFGEAPLPAVKRARRRIRQAAEDCVLEGRVRQALARLERSGLARRNENGWVSTGPQPHAEGLIEQVVANDLTPFDPDDDERHALELALAESLVDGGGS